MSQQRRVRPFQDTHSESRARVSPTLPPILAEYSDSILISLTNQQKAVSHLTVDVAFCYHRPANEDILTQSLSKALVSFPLLHSRILKVKQGDDDDLVLCVPKIQNQKQPYPPWSYVPLSFDDDSSTGSKTATNNGVARDAWFDMAVDCAPSSTCTDVMSSHDTSVDESLLGAPLIRIRVTSVVESNTKSSNQVIALSINHTLVDAGSISLFMSAWSREYQQCRCNSHTGESLKVTFDHPIFSCPDSNLNTNEDVPNEWKRLLPNAKDEGENPFVDGDDAPTASTTKKVSFTCYYRNQDEIKKLKDKYRRYIQERKNQHDGTCIPPYLSSNDVLCGEVCEQLDATSVLLCMDWRPVLERPNFFGYAVLFLFLNFLTCRDASLACRNVLGWARKTGDDVTSGGINKDKNGVVRDPNFVLWKINNESKQGKTDLIWNSWVDFFSLQSTDYRSGEDGSDEPARPSTKMESCPYDMMMSEKMCRARVDVASRGDLAYAILFPQPEKRVRIYFFGPTECGESLLVSSL